MLFLHLDISLHTAAGINRIGAENGAENVVPNEVLFNMPLFGFLRYHFERSQVEKYKEI